MPNPAYQAARARKSREKIIDAALSLFVERGFEIVKLQEVAAAARVSTATLFKHFPQKESLLFAAMETLVNLEEETPPGELSGDGLRLIGMAYARRLDHPMMLGLIRLGATNNERIPDLGKLVMDAWRKPFVARLEAMLDRDQWMIPDKRIAVRQFFGLITDQILWPRLFGMAKATDAGFRKAVVEEAVVTFLGRFGKAKAA